MSTTPSNYARLVTKIGNWKVIIRQIKNSFSFSLSLNSFTQTHQARSFSSKLTCRNNRIFHLKAPIGGRSFTADSKLISKLPKQTSCFSPCEFFQSRVQQIQKICLPIYPKIENIFERKKQELLASQSASAADGETNSAGQPSQLTIMDIWVQLWWKEKRKS